MRRTGIHGIIAVALCGFTAGCSTKPLPKSVNDARDLLARQETEELAALRPQLIEEAREYESDAERAWNDDDTRAAELYGQMSVQRWRTAQNFVRRESAQALIKNMTRARDDAAGDEARRREELSRVQRLLARIDQLAAPKPTDDAALIAAKKSMLEARRKQAEAEGIGAAALAPNPYKQGTTLLAGAIESFELGMIDDSTKDSASAIAAFNVAIEEARLAAQKPKEEAPAPPVVAATPPAPSVPEPTAPPVSAPVPLPLPPASRDIAPGDIDATQRAIHAAEDARADAIGRGGVADASMIYGEALLDSARRARSVGDMSRALEKAKDARQVFAMVRGSFTGRSTAEDLINSLETRRIDLLSSGGAASCPSYEAFQASLELARTRLQAKDEARAQEFALIAQQKLRECERSAGPSPFGTSTRTPALPGSPAPKDTAAAPEKPQQPAVNPEEQARKRAANAIQKAQGALAEARVRLEEDSRLEPLAQLVTSAEAWYDRKEWVEAEDLANRAGKQLGELNRRLGTAAVPGAPTTRPAEETATAKKPGEEKKVTEDQAAAAIMDAQRGQADLESQLGADERLRKPEQLVASAERWFERREFDRALELARDAQKAQRDLGAARPKPGQAKPEAQKPAQGAGAGRSEVCRAARAEVDDARTAARFADPQVTTRSRLESANVMLRSAEDLLDKDQCAPARDLAKQARTLATTTESGRTAEPGRATEPGRAAQPGRGAEPGRAPGADAPVPPRPGADGDAWQDAQDAQARAMEKRAEARSILIDAAQPVFDSGDESLRRASALYEQKRYEASEEAAKDAIEKFELAMEASRAAGGTARGPEAPRPGDPARPGEPARPGDPARPGEPPRGPSVAARAEQAITAYERSKQAKKAPGGWQSAYRQVIAALALRDRVGSLAQDRPAKDAVSRGNTLLTQARAAYGEKRYPVAEQLATGAVAEYQAVLDAHTPMSPAPEVKDDGSEAFKATDQALREAQVLLEVCQREKCPDRDFKAYARAKQLLQSAREAFKDRKYDYAKDLAGQAKKTLEGALEKPSGPPPPKQDQAEQQKKRLAAEDALREANVLVKLCEQKACEKQNLEVWLRSTSLMNAAKASFADQLYDRARQQADESHKILRELLDTKPKGLTVPQGLTRVRLDGNNIVATPAIDFKSGSAVLTDNGKAAVAEVAAVIKANVEQLQGISIVGHTDSRGNANMNRTISANRARAVMQALVDAGVPQALITSEGRGPDQPVADNATEEGRRANRRVDISVKTK